MTDPQQPIRLHGRHEMISCCDGDFEACKHLRLLGGISPLLGAMSKLVLNHLNLCDSIEGFSRTSSQGLGVAVVTMSYWLLGLSASTLVVPLLIRKA